MENEASAIALEARELIKIYRMGAVEVHALRGVDVDFRESELIVLLGPSGSGKSTLLNILGGLDTPTSGTVRFRGQALTMDSERALNLYRRNHVGFVFQFGALDSKTGILVLEAILKINRELGTTTALITHNAVIADIANRVLYFADGRIVETRQNAVQRAPGELAW
ncbi:ABC transporter ATP-binding protein [Sinorhizobium medicae]|uniref:ABC transporter ATP-binding protein n=1 Tax=Sinorhizobium medicae TaxID=110321 RepID=UPI000FDC998C|nr:ABC transporter ATP-binding protein [Sinorhizobium medicae]RVH90666.1 ABC transporter ATP-binding protein [Sinorhizobium medicae]RVP68274.1 ABC transporter ATP-binding protein [Sinorhizobium medicae]